MTARRDGAEGLVTRLQVTDHDGNVVGETDAITFKGLLSIAHGEGLRFVRTRLLQCPTADNGQMAIVHARVRTNRGRFTGLGDACPKSVGASIAVHLIRMAETRAIARALRIAVNIGEVAVEELTQTRPAKAPAATRHPPLPPPKQVQGERDSTKRPPRFRGRDHEPTKAATGDERAMSDGQRRMLFRLAYELGETKQSATERVKEELGCERLEWATRRDAAQAIDAMKRKARGNGKSHPAAYQEGRA